jgi:predicted nucleic acid-binding protein
MIILDTSIVIEYLKGTDKIVEMIRAYSTEEGIGITYITEYELLKYSDKKTDILTEFLQNISVIYPNEDSASRSAQIFRKLRDSGNLINENDILIVGIASGNTNKLITLDSDFKKIDDESITVLEI